MMIGSSITRYTRLYHNHFCTKKCYRCLCSTLSNQPKVAVVGSGPAGYYATQQILKGHPSVLVDIYDRVPVPFGLVRFGVAPDHPEVKNCINTFTQTASHDRCSFLGNVCIGKDVSLPELRQAYTAVVLAYGSEDDRTLGIPGENLHGVYSARAFVNWYNGLPEYKNLSPDLSHDTAVVLGHGNVALDVARILLTPVDILKKTDIAQHALDAIAASKVRRVNLVGRRGPLQVAFTIKELREMTKLPGTCPHINPKSVEGIAAYIKEIPRARKRLTELLIKTATEVPNDAEQKRRGEANTEWHLNFLRSPLEIIPAKDESDRVSSIKLGINKLEGPIGEKQKAIATGDTEEMPCGMILRSIGYKSLSLDEAMPFDHEAGVIPNKQGRVIGESGLYCSGWVKRGPVGVLQTTMSDSFETGKTVVADLTSGALIVAENQRGQQDIQDIIKAKGVNPVTFAQWMKIDAEETRRGEKIGKPREKIVDVQEMTDIAWS